MTPTTKWPKRLPPKGKFISEEHILTHWDDYVTVTMAENDIHMEKVGKATWHDIERAKSYRQEGRSGTPHKGQVLRSIKEA